MLKLLKNNNLAFSLIELIVVIAIIAFLAAGTFVAVNPAKRLGDAKDAIRASDVVAIEKALENAILENYSVPTAMAALTEDTPYMLVTEAGDDTGSCNCNTLDESIARIDLAGEFKAYVGNDVPVDDEATGDDTGYYITRKGNSFYVESCNAYGDEYVITSTCGDGVLEGNELCDSNLTGACTMDGNYYELGYVGTGACAPVGIQGCNNTCDACLLNTACRFGGPS